MKRKANALFKSLISLILCFSMLVGTTFAWFTDSVKSGINTIAAGNLDVELYHTNAAVNDEQVNAETKLFMDLQGKPILWEPGVVSYENLRVANEGDLALAYQLAINTANENFILDPANNTQYGLSQILKVGVVEGGITATDRAGVVAAVKETDWTTLATFLRSGSLLPVDGQNQQTWGVVIYWQPGEDDNRWNLNNGKVLSEGETLQIDLGVKLVATQEVYESDSFGDNYDTEAKAFAFPNFVGGSASAAVVPNDQGQTTAAVTMDAGVVSATVPAGAQLAAGVTKLTLNVSMLGASGSNITLGEDEAMRSLDVHVDGLAENNTVPVTVTLKEAAPKGLNMGNYKVYHVEKGGTKEMTLVDASADFTAHNQFKYDPATGDVTLYMATFSEVVVVAEPSKWKGGVDHSWYVDKQSPYTIANADQLWSFSQIVGGMAKDENGNFLITYTDSDGDEHHNETFFGKTVKLISDINLDDGEESNKSFIFYPVGYWNNEGTYERKPLEERTEVSSGLYTFEGTFDGNGHTIANFYHNTWEMKGDHNWYDPVKEQYYRDGMGLFGRVYKGTVKNLTVRNFKSDGEIATTGVIAAYADGATFENIAIFDCNPRVYNIGNGGIVGCVGWYAKEANLKTTFKNITVDNSNKISALWGSYDVACGGIVGQYYPTSGQSSAGTPKNGGISFENCHISAQLDVYNDVCANYQYYAYRYAGMLIGSVRENETIDGHSYPKMDKITAENCTVHFGTWNDYYYCEIIDNTTASYTHDYQMSRLTQIEKINVDAKKYLPLGKADEDSNWVDVPTSGRANYVIVNGNHATENATCYHFIDGKVWNHEEAGYHDGNNGEKFIDENGDGKADLKEDKQHIYLEFNNLVTGYGWGVTTKVVGDMTGVTILDKNNVMKFEKNSALSGDFLYRVGNKNAFSVGKLFQETSEGIAVDSGVHVSVTPLIEGVTMVGTFTKNESDWTQSTLSITGGTGPAKLTIQDYNSCVPFELIVEVVDATNIYNETISSLGSGNVVLLNDVKLNSGGALSLSGAALYGNDFELDVSAGRNTGGSSSANYLLNLANSTIDNVRIVGAVYTRYGAQTSDAYNNPVIRSSGNSVILNSYVANCASPVRVTGGNLEIVNSTLKGGNFANLDIRNGHVVLDNVTTINQVNGNDTAEDGTIVVGLGVVVYYENVSSDTTIEVRNGITQYNNLSKTQATTYIKDATAKTLVDAMFSAEYTSVQYKVGSEIWVNTGILSMTSNVGNDNVSDVDGFLHATPNMSNVNGYLHTQKPNADSITVAVPNYSTVGQGAIAPSAPFNYTTKNYIPKSDDKNDYCYEDEGTVYISMDEGDTFNWDTSILEVTKNGKPIDYTVTMNGVDYTGKSIAFNTEGRYEVVYTYTDGNNYKLEDNKIVSYDKTYTKKVHITVIVVTPDTKHAEFTFGSSNQATEKITVGNNTYISATGVSHNNTTWSYITVDGQKIFYPIVEATIVDKKTAYFNVFKGVVTITDYDAEGNAVLYSADTTKKDSALPTQLTVVNGWYKPFADIKSNWSTLNDNQLNYDPQKYQGANMGGKVFSYAAADGTYASVSNYKSALCYKSPELTNARDEYFTIAKFCYTDNTRTPYYYYVGYHIAAKGEGGCVTGDTLITLADGTQKRIDQVTYKDQLLVWDFFKGEYEVVPSALIVNHGYDDQTVIELTFDDGTVTKAITAHSYFDTTTGKWELLTPKNACEYVGHAFVQADGDAYKTVKLVDVDVYLEYTESYSLVSAFHYNFITDDMFSLTNSVHSMLAGLVVGENMTYDKKTLESDLKKYGQYTYADFANYITDEQYVAFNGDFLKISVGKGYITFDEILDLIKTYLSN